MRVNIARRDQLDTSVHSSKQPSDADFSGFLEREPNVKVYQAAFTFVQGSVEALDVSFPYSRNKRRIEFV